MIAGSAAGQLEDARTGCERRRKLACGCRERRYRVERRQGEQRERRHQHTIERPRVVRGDGDGQHPDEREAGDEYQGCISKAGDECVAAGQSAELRVGGRDPCERVVLPAVGGQLGRSPQDLRELGGELTPRVGLPAAHEPRQTRGEQRNGDAPEREAERQHHRSDGQGDRHGDNARCSHDEGDEWRADATHVQTLQRVDVGDEPVHEVTAAVRVELARGERLDLSVDRRADAAEGSQSEVVGCETLEVARQRPREREEADERRSSSSARGSAAARPRAR